MNTYRFSLVTLYANTFYLQRKGRSSRGWHLKNWMTGYDLDHKIQDRERRESFRKGYNYGSWFKKTVKVDWRETIFNLKVQKTKDGLFKITFKCKLTPKEAYIIGKALEDEMRYTRSVEYKMTKQGQHGY